MKKSILISAAFAYCILLTAYSFSQGTAINSNGAPADNSAMLDVSSTTGGTLITRMSTVQRNAIVSPANGLLIYNTDCNNFNFNAGTPASPNWVFVSGANTFPSAPAEGTHVPALTQITWNWNSVSGATGYKYNTVNDYASATDNGAGTSYLNLSLNCGTAYTLYVWSYNICGNSTASALASSTLSCPVDACNNQTTMTDSRDSKVYNIVAVGSQCWFAQNLNVGTKINTSSQQTDNATMEKYCYNNDDASCNVYGGLYQWAEAVQYLNGATNTLSWSPVPGGNVQGLCPSGWHIPSDDEWCVLENEVEAGTDAGCGITGWRGSATGGKLKEAGTTHWNSPNTGATNSSGFTALGGGYINILGSSCNMGNEIYFWSIDETEATRVWLRRLNFDNAASQRTDSNKASGFIIRCVKD